MSYRDRDGQRSPNARNTVNRFVTDGSLRTVKITVYTVWTVMTVIKAVIIVQKGAFLPSIYTIRLILDLNNGFFNG